MQQQHEIRWGGMTTTPSDHSTPDGDTAISQNLISENGELRPIMPPKVAFTIPLGENLLDEDGKPLNLTHTLKGTGTLHALHQIGLQNLYIIGYEYGDGQYRLGYGLYACVVVDGSPRFHSIVYEAKGVIRPVDVVIMGNTIVLSYATGLVFSVYREGEGYRALGDKPMQLNMGFGMSQKITPKEIKIAFSKNGDASAFAFARDVSTTGIKELQVFWSKYWEAIASIKEKQEHGVFFHPIFVRYAYRINTEGKVHTLQSPPILLFPSSKDIAYITNVEDQTDENKEDYTKYAWCSLWLSYGELYYTLQHSVSEMRNLVEAWKDIITEVDVFISSPITNIKQDDELKRSVEINDENSDYLPIWAAPAGVDKFKDVFIAGGFINNWETYAPFCNTDENGNKWPQYYVDIPHYTKEDMRERIESASQFYRVATIKLSDMLQEVEDTQRVGIVDGEDIPDDKVISTYTSPLHISKETLETLQQREVLEDDFDSHLTKTSEVVRVYNARLYLANVSKSLFPGYYPEVMFDHSENHYNGPGQEVHHYDVYTYFTKGGKEYITKHSSNSQDCYTRNYLPFIFVPDADATKMVVVNKWQGEVMWAKKFHLTPHKYLNGAFYFNDLLASFGEEIKPFEPPQNIVDANRIFSQTPNQLLASEVNTPFYFPLSSREYVGVGEIRALAPVSVALSQGQVGQFPLYALTDEGTWALSIADDGRLSAKQAATRDVIISKETLLQMDGALAFVTEQGIVFLSGAESSVISSILNYPKMSLFALKGISVFDKLKHLAVEHREYWKGCRLAFDYSEKKLIVFNPDYEYSYIFSNTSQQWATIPRKYMYAINHYPTSLLVGTGATPNVYDISTRDENARVDAVVVSRPVKMGLPDVLKTLTNVVHRGSGGSITTAVYGSVDGKHFHLLGSSKNKFLRKLHGTPYKEFIFVVAIGEMAKSDYLLGSSITFQPKRTNKLR